MGRVIRRYREVYTWNPIDAEYLASISLQAGLIDGIKNVNPPLRLSFMPYASVYTNIYNGETTSITIWGYSQETEDEGMEENE